jgi:hypothetical protein
MSPGPKSRFINHPLTRSLDDTTVMEQLEEPLYYYSELLGKVLVVPAGFITDYASVPRIPLAFLLFGGKAKRAAIVHDWLYSTRLYSREVCDAVFKEAMEATEQGWFARNMMWAGVRVGGWVAWDAPNVHQSDKVTQIMNLEAP